MNKLEIPIRECSENKRKPWRRHLLPHKYASTTQHIHSLQKFFLWVSTIVSNVFLIKSFRKYFYEEKKCQCFADRMWFAVHSRQQSIFTSNYKFCYFCILLQNYFPTKINALNSNFIIIVQFIHIEFIELFRLMHEHPKWIEWFAWNIHWAIGMYGWLSVMWIFCLCWMSKFRMYSSQWRTVRFIAIYTVSWRECDTRLDRKWWKSWKISVNILIESTELNWCSGSMCVLW